MNQDNFSHILNIKILSKTNNSIVNDEHLLEIIKELFLQKNQIFNGINIIWRKIEWNGLHKHFDIGILVINSVFTVDEILFESVRFALNEIEFDLHGKGILFKNQQIIFNILKPLSERISLPDTIGIIV